MLKRIQNHAKYFTSRLSASELGHRDPSSYYIFMKQHGKYCTNCSNGRKKSKWSWWVTRYITDCIPTSLLLLLLLLLLMMKKLILLKLFPLLSVVSKTKNHCSLSCTCLLQYRETSIRKLQTAKKWRKLTSQGKKTYKKKWV